MKNFKFSHSFQKSQSAVFLCAVMFGFVSASWGKSLFQQGAQAGCDSGVEAFRQTLYPLLRTSCIECHGEGGIAVPHSTSDLQEAYSNAINFTNFSNPSASRFVERVASRHWLNYPPFPNNIQVSSEEVIDAIDLWWQQGQVSCRSEHDVVTAAHLLTELGEEVRERWITLRWDLGELNSDYRGVEFAVDVQRFSARSSTLPGSYRLKQPRIFVSQGTVRLASLWVSVNGEVAAYENIYDSINQEVSASNDYTVLSDQHMIVIQRENVDELRVLIRNFRIDR